MLKLSNNKSFAGFTLIESTVAIMILMVGLLAVIQFFPFAFKIISDSQNLTTASSIAISKAEEVSAMNYDNIDTGTIESKQKISTDPTSYLSHYQRQTVVETVDSDFNSSPTDVGLKKITVTVFWYSLINSMEKSIQVTSVVADH